ncbi:IclR family transcriptional regulator [Acuticoccus sp. M5D2P5]|uniref:IclR family transcriptional regulator n=1 Tax=Acuticoccus kalidii TaxID=2910977 RepID=UPI001F3EA1E9|nr:IclR family transcriptional regulator [Acuticoccus kalidii]MCF3935708.1 IclR family transcriptional regulator [Acuticoccus kalidii]
MAEDGPGSVKSGARILDVMEHIANQDHPVSLADVAAGLSIPKSSALMLLRTLVAKQYLERDGAGQYRLDPIFRVNGNEWVGGRLAVLRKLARPIAKALANEVQETVVLGVLTSDYEIEVVEKARSPREVRYEIELGAIYPAYCTSMGRSILAFLPQETVDHYLATVPRTKCTPKTVIDADGLRGILSRVRCQGYAVNIEEHVDGASSVAAPLKDTAGAILGTLNIGCVTANFLANREHIIESLVRTTDRFNAELATKLGQLEETDAPRPKRATRSRAKGPTTAARD